MDGVMSLIQDARPNLLTNSCHDSTLINASQFYAHSNSRKRPNPLKHCQSSPAINCHTKVNVTS